MNPTNLRNRGHQCDEVRHGKGDQIAVGGGVERLGSSHRDHHHDVPGHPHQEHAGLEDRAHKSIQGVVVFRVGTKLMILIIVIPY